MVPAISDDGTTNETQGDSMGTANTLSQNPLSALPNDDARLDIQRLKKKMVSCDYSAKTAPSRNGFITFMLFLDTNIGTVSCHP